MSAAECVECGQPVRAVDMATEPVEGELLPYSRLEAWAGRPLYCADCFEALR